MKILDGGYLKISRAAIARVIELYPRVPGKWAFFLLLANQAAFRPYTTRIDGGRCEVQIQTGQAVFEIRDAANHLKVSKSTVHQWVQDFARDGIVNIENFRTVTGRIIGRTTGRKGGRIPTLLKLVGYEVWGGLTEADSDASLDSQQDFGFSKPGHAEGNMKSVDPNGSTAVRPLNDVGQALSVLPESSPLHTAKKKESLIQRWINDAGFDRVIKEFEKHPDKQSGFFVRIFTNEAPKALAKRSTSNGGNQSAGSDAEFYKQQQSTE